MNHAAQNPPTCQNDQWRFEARKTGNPTTNQTSRAENRNRRAAESQFTAELLENSVVNLTFDLAFPRPLGSATTVPIKTAKSPAAITVSEPTKPNSPSSAPPMKKPSPLSAFFDPVRRATHRKRAPSSPSGTTTSIALLALILVRSFAIPESACAAITYATDVARAHADCRKASMIRAPICSSKPP